MQSIQVNKVTLHNLWLCLVKKKVMVLIHQYITITFLPWKTPAKQQLMSRFHLPPNPQLPWKELLPVLHSLFVWVYKFTKSHPFSFICHIIIVTLQWIDPGTVATEYTGLYDLPWFFRGTPTFHSFRFSSKAFLLFHLEPLL